MNFCERHAEIQDETNEQFPNREHGKTKKKANPKMRGQCVKAQGRIASLNGKKIGMIGNWKKDASWTISVEYDYISQEPTGLSYWCDLKDVSGQYGQEIVDYFVESIGTCQIEELNVDATFSSKPDKVLTHLPYPLF